LQKTPGHRTAHSPKPVRHGGVSPHRGRHPRLPRRRPGRPADPCRPARLSAAGGPGWSLPRASA